MAMLHQLLNRATVQRTTQAHHAKNALKVTVVHIHWLVSIWVNAGHADHYVTNDRANAIVKLADARYIDKKLVLLGDISNFFSRSNRIVKVIVKVIDANDAVLVMNLIHAATNVYNTVEEINQVPVHEVDTTLVINHMIQVVQHQFVLT